MHISIIAAMSRNGVIGLNNQLPWHISADLRRFKALTMGKPILMGRKTHESIGRPLPGRTNIVLTHDTSYRAPGCTVVHTWDEAISATAGAEELMVIGGAAVYESCLAIASRLYLTLIDADFEGDTFFPDWRRENWKECERQTVTDDPDARFTYSFVILDKTRRLKK